MERSLERCSHTNCSTGAIPSPAIQQTVAAFLKIGEAIATRWIQTPKGVLLCKWLRNPESGAVYVFDRQREVWYMLSFEGCEDRFTSESFDRVFSNTSCSAMSSSPACCSPKRNRSRVSSPPHPSQFPVSTKFTNWRNTMRQSASRIRSLANRYPSQKPQPFWHRHGARSLSRQPETAAEFRHSFPRFAHQV